MTLLDKTNTLVVVPAYNEQDSIGSVIEEIKATGFPFVVIDDGSTDETRIRAIAAGARTISLPFNSGVGGALKCGFRYAVLQKYEAIVQIDADGQHSAKEIDQMVYRANRGSSKIILGSRFLKFSRQNRLKKAKKVAIFVLSKLASKSIGNQITDPTSGLRLIRNPVLRHFSADFPSYYLGDTFEALVAAGKSGYGVEEISVKMSERRGGKPSAGTNASIRYLARVSILYATKTHLKIPQNIDVSV